MLGRYLLAFLTLPGLQWPVFHLDSSTCAVDLSLLGILHSVNENKLEEPHIFFSVCMWCMHMYTFVYVHVCV